MTEAAVAPAAFDARRPPSRELLDVCVHCGFCLTTCPTYLLWGEEMDSPRGRITLMKAGLEGRAQMSDSFARHFDACLGCLACVTACPSGVRYGPLIEATRAQVERRHRRGRGDRLYRRLIFALFPHPRRLRIVAVPLIPYRALRPVLERSGVVARLPGRLRALATLAPSVGARALVRGVAARTAARGTAPGETPRLRVGLLTGCVQRVFFGEVNRATARILASEGCEVIAPPGQGCCGALAVHAGRDRDARACARRLIDVFERTALDRIVVNAAGCGSVMKEYGELLADDPAWAARAAAFRAKVRDVSELLVELGPARAPRHPLPMRLAYHDACHLAHAQGIRAQPRALLAAIPGVELVPLEEAEICCGSAGIWNLVEPEPAAQLGARKAAAIAAAAPDAVATANPGCLLQIGASARRTGQRWPLFHPAELVDASMRGVPVGELLRRRR